MKSEARKWSLTSSTPTQLRDSAVATSRRHFPPTSMYLSAQTSRLV
jgi:hypothetical protein